jgi:hypothetical protein
VLPSYPQIEGFYAGVAADATKLAGQWQGRCGCKRVAAKFLGFHPQGNLHSNLARCSEKKRCRSKRLLFFAKNSKKLFLTHNHGDNFLTTPRLSTGWSENSKLFISGAKVQGTVGTGLNKRQVLDLNEKKGAIHRKVRPLLLLLI